MLCGANAAGTALPLMIIYPKAYPGGQYKFGGPDDAVYARSESGWVDSELFYLWMQKVFLKYAVPERPLVLIVDGYKSHLTMELIDLCRENQVILLCLPPHTTHALQPLDVSVFKSLKAHFARCLRAFCFTKKNFVVTKRDFARVVKEPFEMAFSMTNIKNGFRKCGIFPLNRDAIDTSKLAPSKIYQNVHSDCASSNGSNASVSSETENLLADHSPLSVGTSPAVTNDAQQDEASNVDKSSSSTNEFTPPMFSTPNSSVNCSGGSTTPVINPLVKAGLVPENLADILSASDPEIQPKRRIVKARVLTEGEYYEILKEKERKEKEEKEKKEKNRIEREKKKAERAKAAAEKKKAAAEKKAERERKQREKEQAKKGGMDSGRKGKKRKRTPSPIRSSSEESEVEQQPGPSKRAKRSARMPSRFRTEDTDSDSDGYELDTVCEHCHQREPEGCNDKNVFWVDCEVCD